MIEITVLDYLSERITAPVHMEVPEDPPDRFVVLKKADSSREDFLYRSMFLIRSYGPTLLEAALLSAEVVRAMQRLPENPEVSGCYLTGDYNFTDTASKRYRYQAVFDVYHF